MWTSISPGNKVRPVPSIWTASSTGGFVPVSVTDVIVLPVVSTSWWCSIALPSKTETSRKRIFFGGAGDFETEAISILLQLTSRIKLKKSSFFIGVLNVEFSINT
jgi:hypothetical protein